MKKGKIIIGALVIVFVIIQFIRPARNRSGQVSSESLSALYHPPDRVVHILVRACRNCHSGNTHYPWYANVQPFGWWLNRHIHLGKEELNLDSFATYSDRRRISKLRSMKNQVNDGVMPLRSYTWMHPEARLSNTDKQILINWLTNTMDSLREQENQ